MLFKRKVFIYFFLQKCYYIVEHVCVCNYLSFRACFVINRRVVGATPWSMSAAIFINFYFFFQHAFARVYSTLVWK